VKHPDADREAINRVLEWLGVSIPLQTSQWDQLDLLARWLTEEAEAGGGIGPGESDRIWPRHLADSLTFAGGWVDHPPPPRILDVGAGVGLPGIPLAILWPETAITLLDRSGRRFDLARRAVRLLGIDNVEVRLGDVRSEPDEWEGVVFRAVFPPEMACRIGQSLVKATGTVVVGLRGKHSRLVAASLLADYRSARIVDVPATVLDGAVSLLIMGSSEY
jgi:16S rRNA (guanine527-N7)-methyltransferase